MEFSDTRKGFVVKHGEEGVPVAGVYPGRSVRRSMHGIDWRNDGISGASYFGWRRNYTGLMPSDVRLLSALKAESEAWVAPSIARLALSKAPPRGGAEDHDAQAEEDRLTPRSARKYSKT